MAKSKATPETDPVEPEATPAAESVETGAAKAKFAKALEDAKAGAQALGKQAQDTAEAYREKLAEKSEDLIEDAKALGEQARDKAAALASDGKAKVAEGISGISKLVVNNAGTIDEKLGVKYGDYARSAAKSLDDVASKLESKDLSELGEDAREAVRKSPALAIGIAATAGFLVARLFRGSGKSNDA